MNLLIRIPLLLSSILLLSLFAKDNNIRVYKDRGITYHPHYVKKGTIKYAKASWYGKPFHGRLTANGERYNMHKMTAAHRTYAMGTVLKVTSLKNWRSVIVRVNDRGPFYHSRAIDLSYGAAKKLGFVKKGIEKIKIEVLSSKEKVKKHNKYYSSKKETIKTSQEQKVLRKQRVQVASFSSEKSANAFKKAHQLKHAVISKQYLKEDKRTTYKVIIHGTPWEVNHLLKSKKFLGAYKI